MPGDPGPLLRSDPTPKFPMVASRGHWRSLEE